MVSRCFVTSHTQTLCFQENKHHFPAVTHFKKNSNIKRISENVILVFRISHSSLAFLYKQRQLNLKLSNTHRPRTESLSLCRTSLPQEQQLWPLPGQLCTCSTLCCFFSSKPLNCTLSQAENKINMYLICCSFKMVMPLTNARCGLQENVLPLHIFVILYCLSTLQYRFCVKHQVDPR